MMHIIHIVHDAYDADNTRTVVSVVQLSRSAPATMQRKCPTCVCVCVCVCVHTYTYIHACMYTCIYTHVHDIYRFRYRYTYTCTPGLSQQTRSSHPSTGSPYGHQGPCLRPQRGQPSASKSTKFQTPGHCKHTCAVCKFKRPTKDLYGKRDLLIWQKRPTYDGKEGGQALLRFRVVGAFLEKKVREDFQVLGRNLYTHAYTHTHIHTHTHTHTHANVHDIGCFKYTCIQM